MGGQTRRYDGAVKSATASPVKAGYTTEWVCSVGWVLFLAMLSSGLFSNSLLIGVHKEWPGVISTSTASATNAVGAFPSKAADFLDSVGYQGMLWRS